jgi:hypothetical protein
MNLDIKDIALAAELLAAVIHRQELKERYQAESSAARERLAHAAVAIGNVSNYDTRLKIILSVFDQADGVKNILSAIAWMPSNWRGIHELRALAEKKQVS